MAARTPVIYLHVGAMKTGTSYLQQLLLDNKQTLLEQGVLFPGKRGWSDQVLAVRDVLDLKLDNEIRERAHGAWGRLRAEMFAHTGRASVVSMEFLSFASAEKARAVVRSLRGAEVHVVLTVRDASRVVPAQWQENSQNRGTASWPDYVDAILAGRDAENTSWRGFQRALNIPRMLDAWGSAVPSERLHVVLVPPSGSRPAELWERFASVIGVDPSTCTTPDRQRNASLGYASADLMRRVNVQLSDLGMHAYTKTMKSYLSKQVLSGREGEPKVTTNRALSEFALDWNRSMTNAIAKSGAQVVGDPGDLDVESSGLDELEPPSDEQVLDAARDAVAGLQKVIGTRGKRLRAARTGSSADIGPVPDAPEVSPASWQDAPSPVDAAVADVALLARHAIDLRTRLRRADGKPVGDSSYDQAQVAPETVGLVGKAMRRVRNR
jgi:hypothetical protein